MHIIQRRHFKMERLVIIHLLLAFIFVQLVSLKLPLNPIIMPNNTLTFYSKFGKRPSEDITCVSDCNESRYTCIYKWLKNGMSFPFNEGKILFTDEGINTTSTFQCNVYAKKNTSHYGYSKTIQIIVKEKEPDASSTQSFPRIQSNTTTVFSQSTPEGISDSSFLFIVIGISGAVFLIITAIVVGILCFRANKKSKSSIRNDTTQKKDPALELTENVLYITADDVPEVPPSAPQDQDTTATDVYAVVNKENKNVNQIPVYAEVRNSQKGKDNQKTEKKPVEKGENNPGQSANKNGMVYIEIDFNDKPSNGNTVLHGAEDKILYVDIDSVKHADPKIEGNGNHDSQQNGKE